MVDAGTIAQSCQRVQRDDAVTSPAVIAMTVMPQAGAVMADLRTADGAALDDYEAFCREAVHGPAQHPLWVRAWVEEVNPDALIVTASRDGIPLFKLALEVVEKGACRIARFVGGNHANGNFAAAARHGCEPVTPEAAGAILAALRAGRPDIDLVYLSRQNPHFDGLANPLSGLAAMRSPNISLAARLDGGFEALLERNGRRRKLRHYKKRLAKFRQSGGFRLIEAATPQDVSALLDAFFVLKAERLRKMGIADVFAGDEMQAFFRRLFASSLEAAPAPFVLHGLEVGGKVIAVNGLSVTDHSLVSEFSGIDDSDPGASPGYFLNYNTIRWACRLEKQLYDFSVGDEPYKRSWADVETWQFETLLPLTAKGHALAFYEKARATAVRRIKSNDRLWDLIKKLRGKLAGAQPGTD
jgi:CelD/BcsL family acetyltransferase involved in cellulose biosynthesis